MSDHRMYNVNMSNKNVFGVMSERCIYNVNMSKNNVCVNPFATDFFGLVVRNYYWCQF